jgi:hypothetical protein
LSGSEGYSLDFLTRVKKSVTVNSGRLGVGYPQYFCHREVSAVQERVHRPHLAPPWCRCDAGEQTEARQGRAECCECLWGQGDFAAADLQDGAYVARRLHPLRR